MFITLGNGRIAYGELNYITAEMKKATILRLGDSGSVKYFFGIKEIAATENEIWVNAILLTGQLQAVLIKIGEKECYLQSLRQKIDGCYLCTSSKGLHRILTPCSSSFGAFIPIINSSVNKNDELKNKVVNHSKYLEISHLPKAVTLPIDYFEKTNNVIDSSLDLAKQVKVGGTIGLLL